MRFLVDAAVSPALAEGPSPGGHDTVHVRELGMQRACDPEIFSGAAAEERVLLSSDTDFGTLLALRGERKPSTVLFRRAFPRHPDKLLRHFLRHLPELKEPLSTGSVVVFDARRIRIRRLPIGGDPV